ncbi:preprotein translocase subunit YajC [Streptomyces sp. ODS28]|uniref:preprotein translocase subunit YajC n=1 Tax=Streptomyces sp. ODS28 TaxID=3136688 RepID=UPI0031E9D8E2
MTLLPFIVLIGAMFLMTRSAKKKQAQAANMRESMQPGTGVRTIGGMYATVKEVRDDTVLLEVAPGVHSLFAKNAIGAVLESAEFDRILNGGAEDLKSADAPVVPDDASSLTEAEPEDEPAGGKPDFTKSSGDEDADTPAEKETSQDEADSADSKDAKRDGESDAK